MQQNNENLLITHLIAELQKAGELVATTPEYLYREKGSTEGSIGAHVRHSLDFVNALLRGVRIGSVDYADRGRDQRIETDKWYAGWTIRSAIASLRDFVGNDPGSLLSIRSEACPDVRHRSSLSREIEFVYAHMVHHHALINERLTRRGISLPTGFGVAPSTQAYRDRIRIAA